MLNSEQQEGYDKIVAFINIEGAPYFTLTGSAGTGKTYLISQIAKEFSKNMALTAPTHKAVKILADKTGGMGKTIHKFLGLKVQKRKGRTVLVKGATDTHLTNAAHIKVVVVDESSMIGDDLLKHIKEDAVYEDRKYIFVLDRCQLPPVQADEWDNQASIELTKVVDLPEKEHRFTLHKIVRQEQGNPIITTATKIRDAVLAKTEPEILSGKDKQGHGVYIMQTPTWVKALETCVHLDEFSGDVDFCRVVAWTNAATFNYNRMIRGFLGKDPNLPFELGESIVFNETYITQNSIINTGEEDFVVSMAPNTYEGLQCWEVRLASRPDKFLVLDPAYQQLYRSLLQRVASSCKATAEEKGKSRGAWEPYWELKEMFADLRPPYALTVHKSQGSTFTNVFVDFGDIYQNRRKIEADMCLYTAVTRASTKVFIKY